MARVPASVINGSANVARRYKDLVCVVAEYRWGRGSAVDAAEAVRELEQMQRGSQQ